MPVSQLTLSRTPGLAARPWFEFRLLAHFESGFAMTEHAVVIAGGGPTGMMLAGELALAGVHVAIVERRASPDLPGSRAGGLHARTIEVLDQRGIADRFLAEGQVAQVNGFASVRLDISDFPTRHPYGLGLWQKHIERILAGWIDELPVKIYREREVTGFTQDDSGVDIALSDGDSLRAQYLVGCDGGRSLVRKTAGIEFPGWDPTMSALLAEVEMTEEPELGIKRTATGMHALGKVEYEIRDGKVVYQKGGTVGVMLTEPQVRTSEPTLRDLSEGLIAVYGTDYGIHNPTWITRFTDMTRRQRLSQGTRHARGRRSACAFTCWRTGTQHRSTGCCESWMEARAGSQGNIDRHSARYISRGAPSGWCACVAKHHGAGCAHARRRSHRGAARHNVGSAEHG
jgi:2-polyprenyl-6-methoxyphenol hydroxylase and related FAD-dependent oxidoreductases